ncbi:MFS transporter [Paenibacillus chitinolyticus]|uniref:MFS transporter n=1 Tax=Paenibacillus chitinolyticus TaxID=79263 RepID=UPI003D0382F1
MNVHASQVYLRLKFGLALANSVMFTTYAVYFIQTLGLTPLQLLLVGTVLELTVLLFEGITGVVADTYGRRKSVILGMFVMSGSFFLEGSVIGAGAVVPVISLFVWVLISEAIRGFGETFLSGADTAWFVDEVGEEHAGPVFMRAKRWTLTAALLGIGISVGLSTLATNLPFLAGGLLYAVMGVYLLLQMKETKFIRQERPPGSGPWTELKSTWLTGAREISSRPILLMMLAVTVFSGAASEGYDRLWEAHLLKEITFPSELPLSAALWFGLISVLTILLSMLAMWIAEKRLDTTDERIVFKSMFVLTALRIAAVLSFAFSPNFGWALVSLLAVGVIGTVSAPLFETWLNLNIESRARATVLSMMSQSDALGQTAGGPFVGWIGNRLSVRASLTTAAVLLLPILFVFGRVLRKRQ